MFEIFLSVHEFEKCSQVLKNVHDIINCPLFHKIESDSVSWWYSQLQSWSLEIMIFFSRCQARAILLVSDKKCFRRRIPPPGPAYAVGPPILRSSCYQKTQRACSGRPMSGRPIFKILLFFSHFFLLYKILDLSSCIKTCSWLWKISCIEKY